VIIFITKKKTVLSECVKFEEWEDSSSCQYFEFHFQIMKGMAFCRSSEFGGSNINNSNYVTKKYIKNI